MRSKKFSKVLNKAVARSEALASVSSTLDLGKGLTLKAYASLIADARAVLEAYNASLGSTDGLGVDFATKEKAIRAMSERVLHGIAGSFGTDSDEYAKAGAVRKSARKHPTRKAKN